MIACPSCARESPAEFAFCPACGTNLALEQPQVRESKALTEERKVVTTLFCDLVAFTAMSEAADPEDVDALLGEYFARATKVIESHGGSVEKFIGDAVVGVFGVPATHEDDPERAVRAGLRIIETLDGMTRPDGSPLEARIGINTGEALVRLDVDPASGRGFLTGDAVNTAARLESAALAMRVAVGALTHDLTRKTIVYERLEPVAAKGKSEPLEAWLAREPVARTGVQVLEWASPLVGRTVELSYLTALLDKAADSSSPQVALIVGEPGIGKSRLVQELYARVEAGPRLVTWRQGRCLPYGEGVTFWALAEIVKAHAGILESDDRDTTEAKLEQILPEGDDRSWFRQRLRALLGLEAAQAEREENFTAWLRFLEDLASREPTILILEDLQWADEPLLDFLEFLALHVARVPLMLVATARPELFERHPSFAAAVRINRIAVEPLSDDETEELVASVVDEATADLRTAIARQAQGNPFFAEESARLVRDHAENGAKVPLLAGSVQAVIAARLDALAPEQKALVADAAVAGEMFWYGLLAAMGERAPEDMTSMLDHLIAKQLIYRVRTSSMAGEREFAFGHALAREVAYSALPRLVRAKKHQAVAGWIEAKLGERAHELAEILAHHYVTALELARDTGHLKFEAEVLPRAVEHLTRAGRRALTADVRAAERYCSRAMALTSGSEWSPELLCTWATVLSLTEHHREALAIWEEAVERLRAEGEAARAAAVMCDMEFEYETFGLDYGGLLEDALDLVRDEGPSPELVKVLTYSLAVDLERKTAPEVVAEGVGRVIAMSRDLGLPVPPMALMIRGRARSFLGDEGGIEDMERGLRAAEGQGLAVEAEVIRATIALWIREFKGLAASLEPTLQGLETARRRGDGTFVRTYETWFVILRYLNGDWDQALEGAQAIEPVLLERDDYIDLCPVQAHRVLILVSRGLAAEAQPAAQWLTDHALELQGPWLPAVARVASLAWHDARGEHDAVRELLSELTEYSAFHFNEFCPGVVRCAVSARAEGSARQLVEDIPTSTPMSRRSHLTCRALLDEADGEQGAAAAGFAGVASLWHDFGVPYEEGQALLGQGRCLVALGREGEAAAPLRAAREIFARLGAKPALAETEEWLGRAASPP